MGLHPLVWEMVSVTGAPPEQRHVVAPLGVPCVGPNSPAWGHAGLVLAALRGRKWQNMGINWPQVNGIYGLYIYNYVYIYDDDDEI